VRNQYKVLAEKYHIICEAKNVKLREPNPFGSFVYQSDEFNLIKEIQGSPHAKEFVKWLVNKSEYNDDIAEFAADNNITNEVELACRFFDNYAANVRDSELALSDDASEETYDYMSGMISEYYEQFIKEWWPQEKKRLAALNKNNTGIEMDI
jgi:hypothetical protein